jgi:hypothetical protein
LLGAAPVKRLKPQPQHSLEPWRRVNRSGAQRYHTHPSQTPKCLIRGPRDKSASRSALVGLLTADSPTHQMLTLDNGRVVGTTYI